MIKQIWLQMDEGAPFACSLFVMEEDVEKIALNNQ